MCVIESYDRCSVWRETYVRARKQHTCACCKGPIEPGVIYVNHFSVFEGDATCEKMCGQCEVDRQAFCDAHGGMLFPPSSVVALLHQCVDNDEESEAEWGPLLARLSAGYRAAETKPE